MITEDLNKIRTYTQNPGDEAREFDLAFLDGSIKEEYFWLNASKSPHLSLIANQLLSKHRSYFDKLCEFASAQDYSLATHQALRFLIHWSTFLEENKQDFTGLIDVIDSLISFFKVKSPKQPQVLWFTAEVIVHFPLDRITMEHLGFISNQALAGDSSLVTHSIQKVLLPRILQEGNRELLESVITEIILSFRIDPDSELRGVSGCLEDYALEQIVIKDNIDAAIDILTFDKLADLVIGKVEEIFEQRKYAFNSWIIPSIEDTDKIVSSDSFPWLLVKFLREMLESQILDENFVKTQLLMSRIPILRRLGVYAISHNYDKLKELFWGWEAINPLEEGDLKHEVFMLLKINSPKILTHELHQLFTWMDAIEFKQIDEGKSREELEKLRALIAKEFLLALEGISVTFKAQIEIKKKELDSITPHDRKHPGYNYYTEIRSPEEYPASDEEFESHSASIVSIVSYLLQNEQNWSKSQISVHSKRLLRLISEKPELPGFEKLGELSYEYLGNVMYGLEKAWENGKEVNWRAAFQIMIGVMNTSKWRESNQERDALIGYFGWLIRSATRDDKRALEGNELIHAKDICLSLLQMNLLSERLNNDPFFDIINSPEGKILEAMLNVSLRFARLNKAKLDRWFPDVREHYTTVFLEGTYNDAYIYNVAGHLAQFAFLDFNWVSDHINFIFPKEDILNWTLAMRCYTRLNNTVYKDMFSILLQNGHYDLGIARFINDLEGTSDFVQHLVIGHLAQWKEQELSNDKSLIRRLLGNADKSQLLSVISFLHLNKHYSIQHIFPIWLEISKCHFRSRKDKDTVLIDSLKLTGRIDKIDEEIFQFVHRLIEQLPYTDYRNTFIRHLIRWSEEDIEYRARLLIALKEDRLDSYDESQIESMAKKLYIKNQNLADRFINSMLHKRLFRLLDTYNEYHNQN